MRNIFLKKSYTKWGRETIPISYSKKLKLTICLDQLSKVLHSLVFIVWQFEGYRNVLKLSWGPLGFTSYKAFFKKTIRGLELVSQSPFLCHF